MDKYLNPFNSANRLIEEYKKYGSLIIAVDFDDTLYNFHNDPDAKFDMVAELVRKLKSINCEIIIWTGNQNTEFVKQFLVDNNIPYDLINEDSEVAKKWVIDKGYPTPRKLYANAYLDDRGGLAQVYTELLNVYNNFVKL